MRFQILIVFGLILMIISEFCCLNLMKQHKNKLSVTETRMLKTRHDKIKI